MVERRPKVLVVDDEELNRELLDAILSGQYDVLEACNGEEALEKVKQEPPDIILLDVMMPGMDGYEVCRQLKGKKETEIIPVVMVTALREKEDRIQGLEAGADDFLTKPIDRAEVLARVKSLLRIKYLYDELTDINQTLEQRVKEQVEELRRTHAEKERLQKELEIARNIQQSFLPQSIPQLEGFELAATNVPAMEVGGDFYDFIPLAEGRWGLVIADVSGKGISAALFMALSRTLIRATAEENPTASKATNHANRLIFQDARSGMFVTLFYAILDLKEMSLRYVNAGHIPPLLLREDLSDTVLLKTKGVALGVSEDVDLEEAKIQLTKGDLVIFYTDGITEAINERKEQFGKDRLIEVIRRNYTLPAQDIIKKVQDEVMTFTGEQPQFDDITLMVLKVV